MATTFLDMPLATPLTFERAQTRSVLNAYNSKPHETRRPDERMYLLARVRPDSRGRSNLAGRIGVHLHTYGSATKFQATAPQLPGVLPTGAPAFTVAGKTDAGQGSIQLTGTVAGKVLPGAVVGFGDAPHRLYRVTDTTGRSLHLDIALIEDVARGALVSWTPTAEWYWTPDTVASPPSITRGFVAGEGWLLEAYEAID